MLSNAVTLTALSISVLALVVSVFASVVALRNYLRKSGMYIRGAFSTTSSRAGDDIYVSKIILENLKDRAVTIFSIYLRVGYNIYIRLEDLDDQPLVLKPFETYQKAFGPIEFYAVSNSKILLNDLITDRSIKKRLVLATSDGRYKVPAGIGHWNPIVDFFQNHLTAVVHPISSKFMDEYVGGNNVYVIEFVWQDGTKQVLPIHPEDYQIKKFRAFTLTRESLESKRTLEEFLQKQMDIGKLACESFVVHDLKEWRKKAYEFYSGRAFRPEKLNAIHYYLIGKIFTKYSDWKQQKENARMAKGKGERKK